MSSSFSQSTIADDDDDNTSETTDCCCIENDEDELPFAIPENESPALDKNSFLFQSSSNTSSSSTTPCCKEDSVTLRSSSEYTPPLESSMVSSSSGVTSDSLLCADSQMLDAGASVLLKASNRALLSLTTSSSETQQHSQQPTEYSASSVNPTSRESTTFSELLDQADDRIPQQQPLNAAASSNIYYPSRLPILPEEQTVASQEGGFSTFASVEQPSSQQQQQHLLPSSIHFSSASSSPSTILAASQMPTIVPSGQTLTEERRLASLAGATAYATRPGAFVACVDLTLPSPEHALDVLVNPECLRLWYDPIVSLVVNESSDSARDAQGTWVTATTNQLIVPTASFFRPTALVQRASRGLRSAVGFPTYGRLRMFVERQRGHVGLHLGPFPGNVYVSHQLSVQDAGESMVRVVDHVQVSAEESTAADGMGSAVWGMLGKCFLPSTENYMDQTLSSMARLRFLVEGEDRRRYSGDASTPLLGPNA